MTKQQKEKMNAELISQTSTLTNLIEQRFEISADTQGTILLYLQLVCTQNQIIILMQKPTTD